MRRPGTWPTTRKAVKDRDRWRCRKCGKAGRLEVHHLDHNPLNDAPDNLVTWCVSCPCRPPPAEEDDNGAGVGPIFGRVRFSALDCW